MNAKPLTLAQIRQILSAEAPQIVIRKADGEFRITFAQVAIAAAFPGLSRAELIEKAESLAAYESDAESALETCRAMARVGVSGDAAAPAQAETARDNRQAQREGIAAIAEREQAPAVAAVRETIRLEMNWRGAAGIIAAALENGTGAGRKAAREEFARMADCADTWSRFASPVIDLAAAARALLADNNPGSRAALRAALDAIDAAADA